MATQEPSRFADVKRIGEKKNPDFFFKSTSRQKYGLIGHSINNSRFTKSA